MSSAKKSQAKLS